MTETDRKVRLFDLKRIYVAGHNGLLIQSLARL